tara:strand:- start:128 stop:301 length:174 start_codon:yes stop_codon:yes gene_type:complete
MLTLEEVQEGLKDRNITTVAEIIGVHRNTLYALMHDRKSPNYATVKALSDYLLGRDV